MSVEAQIGYKTESTVGTAVTVDRFYPFTSEKISGDYRRVEGKGLRAGTRVQPHSMFEPYCVGADGSIEFEILSRGFGWWLAHLTGAVATAGPTDSAYTHTGTVGTLLGKSFTFQSNRYDDFNATNRPFTWNGGKVAKWSIGCDTEGAAMFNGDLVFMGETTATGLASASYPAVATTELLTFIKGDIKIAGTSIPVDKIKISVDNMLDDKRIKQRTNAARQEPLEKDWRKITFEAELDWDATTQYARVASTTRAGALATLSAQWTGNTLIGVSTYPSLKVALDQARFDKIDLEAKPGDTNKQKLTGVGLFNSSSPIQLDYVTLDSTP